LTGKCITTKNEEWNLAIWLGQAERMKCEKCVGQAGGVAFVLVGRNATFVLSVKTFRGACSSKFKSQLF